MTRAHFALGPLFLLVGIGCAEHAVIGGKGEQPGKDTAGDDDTGELPASNAGDYSGAVDGLYTWQTGTADCVGEAWLTIDEAGVFSGEAHCTSDAWGLLEGPLAGTEAEGAVEGTWSVSFGPEAVAQPLVDGGVSDGEFAVSTAYENAYGAFESTITLTRQ